MQFWFEFGSTYSYPSALRVEELARARGIELAWRPFLLGPIFKDQGWVDSPFNLYPEKGRYMWRDLERTCASLGLAFRRPSRFPRNGLAAARVACCHEDAPWIGEFVRRVYLANFAEDREIEDPGELGSILQSLDLPVELLEAAESPEAKQKLRARTQEARDAGIFGAPSFLTRDGELFWGNDRLDAAVAWELAHREAPAGSTSPAVPRR